MLTKSEFACRLKNACLTVIGAEEELTAIDAKFGDADHGFTMAKVCNAILAAIEFVEDKFGIKMERPARLICSRSSMNNQCLKSKCPFNKPAFTIPTL